MSSKVDKPISPATATCTLCGAMAGTYAADRRRVFYGCDACGLIFADPGSHLDPTREKAVYDWHENDPADSRYRAFLSRLATPLLEHLRPGMEGLDFGSGPGPSLSLMFAEAGMGMAIYDPYYAPDTRVLDRQYDFVTCTEVVEHFNRPARDWPRLAGLVRPGGWLGVMTRMAVGREAFPAWHYKNDPTHVSFYSPTVFRWLARYLGLRLHRIEGDVVLLQRPLADGE
ncbi:MAG: class I SAM-dependent methyltransferase [Thioalkalivibrio sp.]